MAETGIVRFDDHPDTLPHARIDGKDVGYARHHVIVEDIYSRSDFLKALQANNLWDQWSP